MYCSWKLNKVFDLLVRYLVSAQVFTLPLLAGTWIIGLFAVNENDDVYTYIFTALVIIQVLSYCVMV